MTLVAALTTSFNSILIADSRITFSDHSRADSDHRDIGQKVITLGREGLVGFSGDVASAYRVLQGFSGTYKIRGISWIKSESAIRRLFKDSGVGSNDPPVAVICTFIDYEHEVRPGIPGAALITFNSRTEKYTKKYLGLSMIGSGAQLLNSIEKDPGGTGLLRFAGTDNHPGTLVHKSMFMAEVLASSAQSEGITNVGGLFQIHYVTSEGVFAVPYERWISIDRTRGTYVQMDIDDNGRWVQFHKPTGRQIPLGLLGQDSTDFSSRNLAFELQSQLTSKSEGVVPQQHSQLIYRPIGDDWDIRTPGD